MKALEGAYIWLYMKFVQRLVSPFDRSSENAKSERFGIDIKVFIVDKEQAYGRVLNIHYSKTRE
jgi:hypothetical protein